MKVTFLGQAGLLFEKGDFKVMIDPYFSDNVRTVNPNNRRRAEIDTAFLRLRPDVLIFTHNHLDHFDPVTVPHFLNEQSAVTVLAPQSVWSEVRRIGGSNNYVLFNRRTEWTQGGIRFTAVLAVHSDPSPIGVILDDGEKKYYVTGDTLYSEEIFSELPPKIDVLFLPVNGVGNNMNMQDAARFAARVGAKKVVPLHFGMFDALDARDFACENKVIPTIYKEIAL